MVGQTAQLAGRKITELMMADDEGNWPSDSIVELPDGRKFEVNGDVRDENEKRTERVFPASVAQQAKYHAYAGSP